MSEDIARNVGTREFEVSMSGDYRDCVFDMYNFANDHVSEN